MMKQGLLMISLVVVLTGCGKENQFVEQEIARQEGKTTEAIEIEKYTSAPDIEDIRETAVVEDTIDLTKMSSTMVYSQVNDIVMYPDQYIGKEIIMEGTNGIYKEDSAKKVYYSCIIQDATACCAQGIEFQLKKGIKYPKDGEVVRVRGIFNVYEEGGYSFCRLEKATLEKVK
ncbi:MAG: hypothetical protein K6G85_01800 [Eubacterium sp.]|nr:hypothetical protein [Eubacterium sp.]